MSDEFKDFTVTPTLTFDAPQEAAPVVEIKKEEPVALRCGAENGG